MNKFASNYTERARKVSFKFPKLSFILIQINFWIIAFVFLSLLFQLFSRALASMYPAIIIPHAGYMLLIPLIGGVVYGTCTGFIDLFTKDSFINTYSTGLRILIKSVLYFIAFIALFVLLNYFISDLLADFIWGENQIEFNNSFHKNLSRTLFFYTLVLNVVLSYVLQVNAKFGPGVLIPLLLGKYQKPFVERRIFLFMDLRSSTTYAEKLGHLKYSEMIRDCFRIANQVLVRHDGEIYQYIGDEVVITWREEMGLFNHHCIHYYFDFMKAINDKRGFYLDKYDCVPEFKAGIHLGEVTAIEVGEIKKEIAYHGDTINTAARIQSVCNKYSKNLIASKALVDTLDFDNGISASHIGSEQFKGKSNSVEIYYIEKEYH